MDVRTDLAIEAKRLWDKNPGEKTELPGVRARQSGHYGIAMEIVEILNEEGARELHKPIGTYVTVDLTSFFRREKNAFYRTAEALARVLHSMLPEGKNVLVVGLGNEEVTPDTVGPRTLDHLIVTRHLQSSDIALFRGFGGVSAIEPGVLGQTGIESANIVKGILEEVKPNCVIVVDALASCDPQRLCMSVQISDTGLVPGSGVGNHRMAFSKESFGVPVIAIGVPTVVDGDTFLAVCGQISTVHGHLILSHRDIDKRVADIGKVIGYGIDLALHPCLGIEDVSDFLI